MQLQAGCPGATKDRIPPDRVVPALGFMASWETPISFSGMELAGKGSLFKHQASAGMLPKQSPLQHPPPPTLYHLL